ncbi:MAG: hypothetical protein R3213_09300 [Flavobacteriaceae bacterium]|nr:hypothetical protein [Flavobacteriaceae bacterium]
MAPIKFEENMQERLESRRLQPSADSWDKLASRLDKAEKPNKNKFWFFGIAAGILLLVSTGLLFFQQGTAPEPEQTIVEVSNQEKSSENTDSNKPENLIDNPSEVIKESATEVVQSDSEKVQTSTTEKSQKLTTFSKPIKEEIAQVEKGSSQNLSSNSKEPSLITEISPIVETDITQAETTDDELNALLNSARMSIAQENGVKENVNVEANDLLQEIESDIQESFRDKMFEVLVNGYKSVRTAVADRNN